MEKTPFTLHGERAFITGGGSGIGLAIAKSYIQAGAEVIISGRTESKLQAAVAELGEMASYKVHDVLDFAGNEAFVHELETKHGPVSILVNNAGNHIKKDAEQTTEEEYLRVLNTHLVGAHSLTRFVAKKMMKRGRGNVIFIASMASLFGIPYVMAYSAAKSGMLGVVKTLATEWSPKGIRINAIAPGWIYSDMMEKALNNDPQRKNKILSRTPMNTFGDPEDVGLAATYLASPAAKFLTGVCLPVDGGVSIGF